jgi:hypothetical protein
MKMYYILLAFGIIMILLGLSTTGTQSNSSTYYFSGTRTNISGIIGICFFFLGIIVSIISGILIEKERGKSK